MAPRLADYIKKQLEAGYDIDTIRNFLIRNGYDSRDIDEAVDYIYGKPKKELPLKTIGVIVVAIVVLLLLLLIIRGCGKEEVVVTTVISEVIEEEVIEEVVPAIIEEEIIPELGECPASCDDFDECT
ncbi:hypothetical protein GOV06_02405, partial [Candidatus Woesearchaeota archaeon]|nr:hypothetical protein [Candidatus Woesearchaeota archaeon]